MSNVRAAVVAAGAAGVLAAASTQLTMGPRSTKQQNISTAASTTVGLAFGGLVGLAACKLNVRSPMPILAVAGAGAVLWLAASGSAGKQRNSPLATLGFVTATAGVAIGAERLFHNLSPTRAGVYSAALGALAGGVMLAVHGALNPRPTSAPHFDDALAPYSLDPVDRAGVALLTGSALIALTLGATAGFHGLSRLQGTKRIVATAAAALPLGLAAVGATWMGANKYMSFGKGRMSDSDGPVPATSTGGALSAFKAPQLPSGAGGYLRSPLPVDHIRTYWNPSTKIDNPIRAYVSNHGFDSVTVQANEAVAELDRLGAFSRSTINVFVPTGSGGMNDGMIDVVEIFAKGDIATIGVQYADKPSIVATLSADEGVKRTVATISAIKRHIDALPTGSTKPRIVLSGYSLGAEIIHKAMLDEDSRKQILEDTDGIMMIGPRNLAHNGKISDVTYTLATGANDIPRRISPVKNSPPILVVRHNADPEASVNGAMILADTRDPSMVDQGSFIPFVTAVGEMTDMLTLSRRDAFKDSPWRGHGYSADIPAAVRASLFPASDEMDAVEARISKRTDEMLTLYNAKGDSD